ncbi:MAG: hypothetical protein LC109_05280 [Bacteroidia bacterium]|nr:hypothetical protein [Bacteroidia bacterium]
MKNKLIDILLKIGTAMVLIIAATTKQQYSYYSFIRLVVLATAIYFAYKAYSKQQIGLVIYFAIAAILFNPFKLFWFQKEIWHLIDWIVAAITLLTIYFDFIDKPKPKDT